MTFNINVRRQLKLALLMFPSIIVFSYQKQMLSKMLPPALCYQIFCTVCFIIGSCIPLTDLFESNFGTFLQNCLRNTLEFRLPGTKIIAENEASC